MMVYLIWPIVFKLRHEIAFNERLITFRASFFCLKLGCRYFGDEIYSNKSKINERKLKQGLLSQDMWNLQCVICSIRLKHSPRCYKRIFAQ